MAAAPREAALVALPTELVVRIVRAGHLAPEDVFQLAGTCRRFWRLRRELVARMTRAGVFYVPLVRPPYICERDWNVVWGRQAAKQTVRWTMSAPHNSRALKWLVQRAAYLLRAHPHLREGLIFDAFTWHSPLRAVQFLTPAMTHGTFVPGSRAREYNLLGRGLAVNCLSLPVGAGEQVALTSRGTLFDNALRDYLGSVAHPAYGHIPGLGMVLFDDAWAMRAIVFALRITPGEARDALDDWELQQVAAEGRADALYYLVCDVIGMTATELGRRFTADRHEAMVALTDAAFNGADRVFKFLIDVMELTFEELCDGRCIFGELIVTAASAAEQADRGAEFVIDLARYMRECPCGMNLIRLE